jgi:hypothetical protein
MVYAHILIAGNQTLHVTLRFGFCFQSDEDEERLRPHILDTVIEESGHLGLLRTKLEAWQEENGFTIQEIDVTNAGMPLAVDSAEHIRLLEVVVRGLACEREQSRKELEGLKQQLDEEGAWSVHFFDAFEQTELAAAYLYGISHIAEHKFKCDHLRRARAHHAEWVQDNLH